MKRNIIEIDREKCNGCGLCIDACHEGAIALVDGKAELISDEYCDGLGNCLPECPTGAIRIVEKDTAEYNHELVMKRMEERKNAANAPSPHATSCHTSSTHAPHAVGCPGQRAAGNETAAYNSATEQGSRGAKRFGAFRVKPVACSVKPDSSTRSVSFRQ